jgi:TatD DNase family protein
MEFVDTHCHLHFENFGVDREEAYRRAIKSGVGRIICVGTTLADSRAAVRFAASHEGIWAAAGAHPHEADYFLKNKNSVEELREILSLPKIAAAGEIGLDYYKSQTSKLNQEKALRAQIEVALSLKLPFIFHVRDGWADFWRIFDEYAPLTGVVHSFSSGTKQLRAALDRGLYIGLNGIMTFTKDQAQLEAARRVPLDRLVLETDAPYLTPNPVRDEVSEPRHTVITAEFLDGLRSEYLKELSKATTDNAVRLFNLK